MLKTKEENTKKVKTKSTNMTYKELASPGKGLIFLQLLCYIIHYVLKAVGAIFTARIIVGVYNGLPIGSTPGDFSYAYFNLILELTFLVARNIFSYLTYVLYNKSFNKSFIKASTKLIDKLLHSKTSNFTKTSNEKIQNIMLGDVDTLSYISDNLTQNISKVLQAIVCLVIVAKASWLVALITVVFCTINYFILKHLNTVYSKTKEKQFEAKEGVYEAVNRILESKDVINEFDANGEYEKKYLKACKKYTLSDKRRYTQAAKKDVWYFVYYSAVISLLTAVMIFLVSKNLCSVELYLIVVPYFLTITEQFNSFFNITQNLADKNVALSRVSTILNFTDEEINKFGNININNGATNISFVGVNYLNKNKKSPYYGELNDVDISFAQNSINLVYGSKWCGKRLIFNMLRRRIEPDSGVVLLNNINIKEYNPKGFNSNVYYCTAKPDFIDGTIMENFTAIERNKQKIYKVCKRVDIYDDIMSKPKGFKSEINASFSRAQKFLIGLARALLTNCSTLLIYEIPNSLTQKDKDRITSILWQLSKHKTIILFTHTDEYRQIAKTTYCIDEGMIVDIDINDNNNFCLLQQFNVSLGNNLIEEKKPTKPAKRKKEYK